MNILLYLYLNNLLILIFKLCDLELVGNTADYILQCQSYEGGFGGEPGNEAHGGYNFCAIAALLILQQVSIIFFIFA